MMNNDDDVMMNLFFLLGKPLHDDLEGTAMLGAERQSFEKKSPETQPPYTKSKRTNNHGNFSAYFLHGSGPYEQ